MNEVPETFDFMPFGEAIKDALPIDGGMGESMLQ